MALEKVQSLTISPTPRAVYVRFDTNSYELTPEQATIVLKALLAVADIEIGEGE